jgi:hypothetical protein
MRTRPIFLSIAVLLVFFVNTVFGQETPQISPGMSMSDFAKVRTNVITAKSDANGTYTLDESVNGIKGTWSYHFTNSVLTDYKWNARIDKIDQANFDNCLNVINQLIGRYRKMYNEPYKKEEGTLTFRDPSTDHHSGYKVKEAWWKYGSDEMYLGFTFTKEKNKYHFNLEMTFAKAL